MRATIISVLFIAAAVSGADLPDADSILINANVRTLDREHPRAEAIAIRGGKIIAVGKDSEIRLLAGERTRVIDVKGRLVLPGFNDSHVHFAAIGNKFSSLDVRLDTTARSVAAKVGEYVRFLPKGRWVLGSGFSREFIAGEGGQLKALVDAAAPNNPVFLYSSDGKTAFANAAALTLARVRSRTSAGAGPLSANGILTGTELRMMAAAVPPDHLRNWAEILETASSYAASFGVTSVQDMHSDELAEVYRQLDRAGKLKTRIYDCSPISAVPKLAAAGVKAAAGDAMVRTGCVKYFSEGDAIELAELRREIAAADKAGLQVMIHAIGPSANQIALDAFEWAAKQNGVSDRRFRMEHAQAASVEDAPRFGRAGIIPSMQPWLFRGTNPLAYKKHLEFGSGLALGSDAPMVDLNPLLGIYAAVDGPGGISVEEAVRAYTVDAAFAEFQEKVKGKIKAGYLADLVVLSDDIFAVEPSVVRSTRVLMTIMGGVTVHDQT